MLAHKLKSVYDDNALRNVCNTLAKKAMDSKDKKEWKLAMDKEIRCILLHDTWILVDRPLEGTTFIDPKWVCTFKKLKDCQSSRPDYLQRNFSKYQVWITSTYSHLS